jgi:prevent-host-death family protein
MSLNIMKDIHSITELKRNTGSLLSQLKETNRPIILTVNGKAEAVLLGAEEYEKISSAFNLLKLLLAAEEDIKAGQYKEARSFFEKFKREKNI